MLWIVFVNDYEIFVCGFKFLNNVFIDLFIILKYFLLLNVFDVYDMCSFFVII